MLENKMCNWLFWTWRKLQQNTVKGKAYKKGVEPGDSMKVESEAQTVLI